VLPEYITEFRHVPENGQQQNIKCFTVTLLTLKYKYTPTKQ
jgi:hypothetical protein